MAEYLAAHPDVYMAKKEMHLFGADLQFSRRFYRRNQTEYLAEYSGWDGQQRSGEASVWYLFSKQAASEIHEFNANARIIIMLRNPVDMLYSLYHQFRFDGNEHLSTFEEALDAEQDRRDGRRIRRRTYFRQGLAYRDCARYCDQVRRYFEVFGRDQVLVINYDDFASAPHDTYKNALEFLGVDSDRSDRDFRVVNGNKVIRSRMLWSFLSDPYVRRIALMLRAWLPRPAVRLLYRTEARLWAINTRFAQRSALSPEVSTWLKRDFVEDVEGLSDLLGRDLTHWTRQEPSAS